MSLKLWNHKPPKVLETSIFEQWITQIYTGCFLATNAASFVAERNLSLARIVAIRCVYVQSRGLRPLLLPCHGGSPLFETIAICKKFEREKLVAGEQTPMVFLLDWWVQVTQTTNIKLAVPNTRNHLRPDIGVLVQLILQGTCQLVMQVQRQNRTILVEPLHNRNIPSAEITITFRSEASHLCLLGLLGLYLCHLFQA